MDLVEITFLVLAAIGAVGGAIATAIARQSFKDAQKSCEDARAIYQILIKTQKRAIIEQAWNHTIGKGR